MRLTLLALTALAAYEYDKKQVRAGKESMFTGVKNFVEDMIGQKRTAITYPAKSTSAYTAPTAKANY